MFRKKAPRGTYPFSVMPLLRNLMGVLLGAILLGLPVMNARADFPDKPITGKPLEVRQGKGKGNVEYWVAQIQPGRVLYEVEGVSEQLAREAFDLAAAKLPVQTTFVKRSVM